MFIDTDCPLLPTHFHLLNITVAQEWYQAFCYFESLSKTSLKRVSSEKARQAFLKGKKNVWYIPNTVRHMLGECKAVCHISVKLYFSVESSLSQSS